MKYFKWQIFFTNLLRSFILNTAAIVLLGLGIWKRELLYAGLAVLAVDIILAFVKTYIVAKTFENTDNPDMLDFRDALFNGNPRGVVDEVERRIREQSPDFAGPEDSPEVKTIKRELGENPTVDEVIDVFRGHCLSLGEDDLMLFETGVYEDYDGGTPNGKKFHFILTRQTDESEGLVQLQIILLFDVTPGNRFMRMTKWSDSVEGDFFEFIRSTKQYEYAKNIPYIKISVFESPTD